MAWTARKVKIYARATGAGLVLLLALLFIAMNHDQVKVWFFWVDVPLMPAWRLIVLSALAGIAVFWVARKVLGVMKDIRQLRQEDKIRAEAAGTQNVSPEVKGNSK
jgi:uncharacterized integral membrane protein